MDSLLRRTAEHELAVVLAYIRDRSAQYDNGSGIVSALEELHEQLRTGEHRRAAESGELDDLLARAKSGLEHAHAHGLLFFDDCQDCQAMQSASPKCSTTDCDNPAEKDSDLCAQCHDKAEERQDARYAEGLY